MKTIERTLTETEIKKAEKEGAESLIPTFIHQGYGVYGARIVERDGKKVLIYERGESCE